MCILMCDQTFVHNFPGRLLVEDLHHTEAFEISDGIEALAGINGALVTLVNDTGSQGELEASLSLIMSVNYWQCTHAVCVLDRFGEFKHFLKFYFV